MELNRQAVALCALGTRAEFEGHFDEARRLYSEAWNCSTDDYDKCIAAHYVAHLESDPAEALRWNLLALTHAQLADQEWVASFLPSLYINLGRSYELTGDAAWAKHYYGLAAALGLIHRPE